MNSLIAFFEIPASDFKRAVDFYETVLGVKLSVSECEAEKMACFMENGVLIHFHCSNMEQTLGKITANGGKVITPKTKIEAEGNKAGIYSDR